ncbi:MAG: hypothetical protein O3A02_03865 [bacterium]|nr:hypothetical protein [bacterium]
MLACASRGIVLGFHKSTRDPYGNVNGSHCDLCQRTITVDDWNAAMGLR